MSSMNDWISVYGLVESKQDMFKPKVKVKEGYAPWIYM